MTDSVPFQTLGRAGLAGATAFGLTLLLTPLVRSLAVRYGRIAKPVDERWGRRVIARFGGVAMYLGFMAAILCWVPLNASLLGLLLGTTLVFGLGLWDDLRRIPPYTKLVAQLLISSIVVASGIRISLAPWIWVAIPLSILWFVLIMNAFNLLDNMDGLAAGAGAIAAAFCAWHAATEGQWTMVAVSAALVGSCLGFLRFNFPPAKIYMGDSGSHLLGLGLAMVALIGNWHQSTRLLSVLAVPTLVLAVPIFDTCFVTIQRLLHRLHPFRGGTDHVSHRLAILGLSVRRTVLVLYSISIGLGLLSIATARLSAFAAASLWLVALTLLVLFGGYLARVQVYRLAEVGAPQAAPSIAPVTLIATMLLHKRRLLEVVVDFCLLISAYVLAYLLRFEGLLTVDLQQLVVQSLPIVLVSKLACLAGFGLYRGVWRYAGLPDIMTVVKASTLGSVISACLLLYLWRFEGYSRAVLIIDWMLALLMIGGARAAERLLDEWVRQLAPRGRAILIIGAGDTGARVLQSLRYEGTPAPTVLGLLDDDVTKWGSHIRGARVLGPRTELARVLAQHHVDRVLVAINDPPGDLLQHVRECCEPRGIVWHVVTVGVTPMA